MNKSNWMNGLISKPAGSKLSTPQEFQEYRSSIFYSLVKKTCMYVSCPGQSVDTEGLLCIVGVSPSWNKYDVDLCIELESIVCNSNNLIVRLFDFDQLDHKSQYTEHIPIELDISSMPVVGIWNNGKPVYSGCGSVARSYLLEKIRARPTP